MAKRKLNKTIRDAIIDGIARRKIDQLITPIHTMYKEHIKQKYLESIPPYVLAAHADPGLGPYMDVTDGICLETPIEYSQRYNWVNNMHSWFNSDAKLYRVRTLPLWGCFYMTAEDIGLKDIIKKHKIVAWDDTCTAFAKESMRLYQEISDALHVATEFLATFTTVEGLLEAAPELLEFIPAEQRPFQPMISMDVAQKAQALFKSL